MKFKIASIFIALLGIAALGANSGCASGSTAGATTQISPALSSVLTTLAVGADIAGYNAARQELLNLYAEGKISGPTWSAAVAPALNQAYEDAQSFEASPTTATLQKNFENDIGALGTIAANYLSAAIVPPVGGTAPPVTPPPVLLAPTAPVGSAS